MSGAETAKWIDVSSPQDDGSGIQNILYGQSWALPLDKNEVIVELNVLTDEEARIDKIEVFMEGESSLIFESISAESNIARVRNQFEI